MGPDEARTRFEPFLVGLTPNQVETLGAACYQAYRTQALAHASSTERVQIQQAEQNHARLQTIIGQNTALWEQAGKLLAAHDETHAQNKETHNKLDELARMVGPLPPPRSRSPPVSSAPGPSGTGHSTPTCAGNSWTPSPII